MKLLQDVKAFLREPYPFYFEGRTLRWLVGILFLMAVFFEIAFRPFGVYTPEHRIPHFWIAVFHSTVAATVFISCSYFVRITRLREHWTVRKDILFLFVFLLITGVGQFLIRDLIYDNPYNWSWNFLLEEVRNTLLTGFLFVLILVPLNQARLSRKHSEKARSIYLRHLLHAETVFPIQTELKGDDFSLNSSDFLFAKAEGNYVAIYLKGTDTHRRLLKRLRLSDLEEQLSGHQAICRCHRSYLVNLQAVRDIQGNAQGYRLKLEGTDEEVLVSRGMTSAFEDRMQYVA